MTSIDLGPLILIIPMAQSLSPVAIAAIVSATDVYSFHLITVATAWHGWSENAFYLV